LACAFRALRPACRGSWASFSTRETAHLALVDDIQHVITRGQGQSADGDGSFGFQEA
ncbi:unnamed protein product, partial [Amoebophrya sp. A25]